MLRFLAPFLVIVPLLANDIPLPEPAIVPSVHEQSDPEIASDGHDYLAVWCRDGVRAQRIRASGELIGGELVVSDRLAALVRIVWTGSSYLIVYDALYARVSPTGEVLRRDVTLGVPVEYLNAISWNGTDLLISYQEPQGRVATNQLALFAADLSVIQARIPLGLYALLPVADGFQAFGGNMTAKIHNDGTVGPSAETGIGGAFQIASSGKNVLLMAGDGTLLNFTTGAVYRVSGSPQVNLSLTGSPSGFLFTWTTFHGIFGVRLDPSGAQIDSTPFQISSSPYINNMRGVSNGDSYFLVWSDGRRTAFYRAEQVWGAYIPLAHPEVLHELPIVLSPADQFGPSAAFNGSIGLIAWGEETFDEFSRVVVTRFAADGTILDAHGIEVASMGIPSGVATDGRDFLVVWRDPEKQFDRIRLVRAALVRADGTVGTIQTLSDEQGSALPSVTFDGTNYFVIWDDGDDGYYLRRLHAARVTRDGFLMDAMPFDLGLGWNAAIAFDGASERILYLQADHGLVTRRITHDGFPLDSSATTLDPHPSSPTFPAIACSRGACLAVWDHADSEVDAALLKATGDVGAPFPVAAIHRVPVGAAVVADSSGFFATWTDWNGRDDDIRGERFSTDGAPLGFVNVAMTGANEVGAAPVAGLVAYSRDGRMYLRTAFETGRRRTVTAD